MANSDFLWNEFRFSSNLIPYFRLFVNRTRVVEFFEIGDEICGFWRNIHNLQGGNFKYNLKITPLTRGGLGAEFVEVGGGEGYIGLVRRRWWAKTGSRWR